jgi:hypothetical protein
MKLFNKEFIIPDIEKNNEKLSSTERKFFDSNNKIAKETAIEKRKSLKEYEGRMAMPDTVNVSLKKFNSKNNEATNYGFNNQTKEFSTITYFDSDPLLQDETIREEYFFAQSMKYELYKGYYSNGNLKGKSLSYSNILIKQYEYDENGKLIKEFDLSTKYKLSVTDVLKILEKNNIGIYSKLNSVIGRSTTPFTYLSCWETNRGKIWHLENYEGKKEYIIFDETGELISQKRFSEEKGSFMVLSRDTYKMRYKDKTIEEVERETGLKLFVYDHNY